VLPQALRHLLHAAHHQVLVLVAAREHHAQDLQHRVGKVRIPAAGAKANLAEHLAVVEREPLERAGLRDEVVEGAVVPERYQPVPQRLQARHVALAQGVLQFAETGAFFERAGPGVGHLTKQRRQIGQRARAVRAALEVDHRAAGRGRQRVGEGPGLQPELVHVVEEGRARARKAHAAQFGHHPVTAFKGLRAQAPAQARGLIDDRPEAQPHELVCRGHARHARAHDGHLGAVQVARQAAQARGVVQPVVEGEGEVGAEDGDGLVRCHGAQKRDSSSHKAVPHIMSATRPSSTRHRCSEFRRRPIQKAAAPKPTNQISEPVAAPRPNTWLAGP
jgi:hypothetical protein